MSTKLEDVVCGPGLPTSIVHGLVALREPGLMGKLEFDPEADSLTVRSRNRAALVKVANLVALAKRDDSLLRAAIARAKADGELE